MLISYLTLVTFSLVHIGADMKEGWDTFHPFLICFGATLVGFTCPCGGFGLVLKVPHWHVMLSSPLHFTDDDVIVETMKNFIMGFTLHITTNDLHLDLHR
jgi:hypothetical protein